MNRRFQYAVVASSTCIVFLLLFGAIKVHSASPDQPYTQLGVYSDVLTKIKLEYVEEPDIKAVTLGAVNGMLESIDPFASFLDATQYKKYQAEHGKGAADVGLYLSRGPGYLRIVDALPGSPSDKEKLTTGDVIESINGISTRDMPLAYAELLLQGAPGTTVELAALTARQTDPLILKLTRAAVVYPAVTSHMVTDGPQPVGVVTTGTLMAGQAKEIAQKVSALEKQGAKKIVLDLRFCALGPTEEGVALADQFMDSGLIAYTSGQKARRQDFTATPETVTKLPLVVLTNRGTAGAAEVAAAALQDSGRAQLVGEPTFGDAAIHKAITLDDGSAIILATAKYYSPKGKAIQDVRVTPTVLQAQYEAPTAEDDPNAVTPAPTSARDLILRKGLGELPAILKNVK
ncbi:MAG: S41 family peptidase [Acidobacteriota bacterium]